MQVPATVPIPGIAVVELIKRQFIHPPIPSLLRLQILMVVPIGTGGSITLDAGAGYSSYSWNRSGGTNQTAIYSSAHTFIVTVTNSYGCSATASQVVTDNGNIAPSPVITDRHSTTFCLGGSISLDAGSGFTTYLWSNNLYTETIGDTPSSTTTYSVTVTDGNNCSGSASQVVTVYPLPVITSISNNSPICAGSTLHLYSSGTGIS